MLESLYLMDENGEKHELGHIEEAELTTDSDEGEPLDHYFDSEPIELTAEFENPSDLEKLVCGFDKGLYNGHVLKRDGYLSPKNGWL